AASCTLSLHDALPISFIESALVMPKQGEDHAGAFVEGEIVACALERVVVLEQGFGPSACPELGESAPGRRNGAEPTVAASFGMRSEEHTSELQSPDHL